MPIRTSAGKFFALDDAPTALRHRRLPVGPRRRPLDRNRERLDARPVPAVRDRRVFVADARFEVAIDRIDEVAAMVLRMEAEDRAAEQSFEDLLAPRANAERFRIRPWNVPERDDRRLRQPLVNEARQQREVIVLDEHDRVVGLRLRTDGLREALVHVHVLLPVAGTEDGPHMRDVTERPQAFVGESVVIPALLFLGEPDATQRVRRIVGRHVDAILARRRLPCPPYRCRARSTCQSRRA